MRSDRRLFAFDLDGTLISCRERQVAVARAVLMDLGVDSFDEDQFWLFKRGGKSTHESLQLLGLAPDMALRASSGWFDVIEERAWLALDRLFPCAEQALTRVHKAGFVPVLISARRYEEAARSELASLGLTELIGEFVVVPPVDAWSHKADVLSRMRAVGFIGDTENDARAAATAMVPFAAVCGGQRDRVFLQRQGITMIYATVDEAVVALLVAIRKDRRTVAPAQRPAPGC